MKSAHYEMKLSKAFCGLSAKYRQFSVKGRSQYLNRSKVTIIFLVALLILSIFVASNGRADSANDVYQMDDVVVTATRSGIDPKDIAASITVVTREDLENMPGANVAEVLQYIPGVYVEFNGGLGSDATGVRI